MQRHGLAIYQYCREALRDATLAEDVHQQTFIAAFRDLERFAGRSTLRVRLFGIARHRVLDAAKRRRRAKHDIDDSHATDLPDHHASPADALDEMRLQQALVASLGELDVRVLTAVLLRYQQGFTFEEMANICGEKPGTLNARVARALPHLRLCIERRTEPPKPTAGSRDRMRGEPRLVGCRSCAG